MRFDRGREPAHRLERQRLRQPAAQPFGKRLEAAAEAEAAVGKRSDLGRIFFVAERTAKEQRQRNHADGRDVRSPIEQRRVDGDWQHDVQLFPVPLRRILQLRQRSAEHVLDDRHLARGRDDDAIGGEGAVARVWRVLVQFRHRRDDLPDETERRVDVERQQVLLGNRQHPRQPHAVDVARDERQARRVADLFQFVHAGQRLAAHVREPVDALAHQEFKRGDPR